LDAYKDLSACYYQLLVTLYGLRPEFEELKPEPPSWSEKESAFFREFLGRMVELKLGQISPEERAAAEAKRLKKEDGKIKWRYGEGARQAGGESEHGRQ